MRRTKRLERGGRQHRQITVGHENVAREIARNGSHAASCGVAGAALLGLNRESERRGNRAGREGCPREGLDLARLMPDDDA